MAPVGRWQKGKDLHWYARDKKATALNSEAAKEEIRRIKEEEEQLMREALGLAPKRAIRPQGNQIDKHEYAELIKRGSAAEDLGGGHTEAAQVQGLGLYKITKNREEAYLPENFKEMSPERDDEPMPKPMTRNTEEDSKDDEKSKKRWRREERWEERRREKHDSKRSRYDHDKRRHRREEIRRHGS